MMLKQKSASYWMSNGISADKNMQRVSQKVVPYLHGSYSGSIAVIFSVVDTAGFHLGEIFSEVISD